MIAHRRGPGIKKARAEPLYRRRQAVLFRSSDNAWRDLLAHADVVSEGAVRDEDGRLTWFGSTILLIPMRNGPNIDLSDSREEAIASLARQDPHLRTRAVRMALGEAAVRAPAPLGRGQCDVRMEMTPQGLRIEIDVQAPLIRTQPRGRMLRGTG